MLLREIFLERLSVDHTGLSRDDLLRAMVTSSALREEAARRLLKETCSKEELETIIKLVSNPEIIKVAAQRLLSKEGLGLRELKVIEMLVPSLRIQVEKVRGRLQTKERIFQAISTTSKQL